MKRIYKYQLQIEGIQQISMPVGAQILKIDTQANVPVIWALVAAGPVEETRVIETFGTGHEIPDDPKRTYLGSYQVSVWGNLFVGHVFEQQTTSKV